MTIILVRENYVALRHLNQMVEECYPGSTIVAFSSAEKAIEMIKKKWKTNRSLLYRSRNAWFFWFSDC